MVGLAIKMVGRKYEVILAHIISSLDEHLHKPFNQIQMKAGRFVEVFFLQRQV